jgi:pilus assembly protein CpaE
MLDNTILIKIESKTASLRKSLDEIIRTTDGLEVQRPSDNRRSDLLIFELGEDAENELQAIQSLLDLGTVDEVFLTSKETDPQVLLKAMRAGAKEFFSQPLKMAEVRNALDRYRKKKESATRKEPVKVGQIIDVIGSKGGVGTTTIAVNLAVSLADARDDLSVALVDMNMLFGEIPLFLAFKPNYHWGEITKNFARLDATFLTNILSKHASGVHVLPSPSSLNGQFGATPEIIEHLLGLMQRMFDFVVVDGGQSLNETSLKIIEMSNNVLLVSLLSLPCLSNAAKLLYSFSSLGHLPKEDIKIVINRYVKDSEISLKDAEDSIRKEIFWTVPNDYTTTMSAINRGKALSQFASKAPITENLKVLADALQESKEQFKSMEPAGRMKSQGSKATTKLRGSLFTWK